MFKTQLESKVVQVYKEKDITKPEDLSIENICTKFPIDVQKSKSKTMSLGDDEYSLILLNKNQPIYEQRWDFFHEISHLFMHTGDQRTSNQMWDKFMENQADQLAIHAALPYHILRNYLYESIESIASLFILPIHVVTKRMEMIKRKKVFISEHFRPKTYQRCLKSGSYNPSKWSDETRRVMHQLQQQVGEEVVNYVGLLRGDRREDRS